MDNDISSQIFNLINEANEIINYNPNKAKEILNRAYSLCEKSKCELGKAYYYHSMALIYRTSSNIIEWIDYSYKSLNIFKKQDNNLGIAKALNSLGSGYFHFGQYEEALLCFLQSLNVCDSLIPKDSKLFVSALSNIGEVYRATLQFNKAYEYYNFALSEAKEKNLSDLYAQILLNLGQALCGECQYDKALKNFMESYYIAKKLKNIILLSEIETQIGYVHFQKKNYSIAMKFYTKALNRMEQINHKYYSLNLLLNIGILKLETNSNDGIEYFNEAIKRSQDLQSNSNLGKAYDYLYKYYEESQDFKNALFYLKKYHEVSENIASTTLSNKLEILQVQYNHSLTLNHLEEINILNKNLEKELSIKNKTIKNMEKENSYLKTKALNDALTQLPNRYALNYKLESIWNTNSINKKIAFFILDIDNFKLYNDYWGHPQGDRCLTNISKCLKEIQTSRNDFCGRYGGEEFIYLAEDISYEEALSLGITIRKKIKQLDIRYTEGKGSPTVTVSIGGVYGSISTIKNSNKMLDIADKQLYNSKNAGRDNVTLFNFDLSSYYNNLKNEIALSGDEK